MTDNTATQHADIAEAIAKTVGLEVPDRINDIVSVPWSCQSPIGGIFDPMEWADDTFYALGKLTIEHFELHKPENSAWTATIYLADATAEGEGETPQAAICRAILALGEGDSRA